ncbi:hypothetical protein SCP_0411080 [Sparassis crispa]|uniref:Uncharacterized protein n=1 Tax=Sparassis crispa TaxID=139825 RepID=A0A401GKM3_9APHY|nr:hypothetical protein SCP_0411080 [Sparassis crispa]GBE82723.1 hypothetical protein SCP_0411080 [Sparassis crispa]
MCDSINPVPTNPESYPTSALSSAQSTFGLSPAGGIWLSNPWHGSSRVRAASTHLPSNQRMPEVRRWTRARIPAFPLRDARPIGGIALGEINPLMSRVRQFGGVSARNISEYLVPLISLPPSLSSTPSTPVHRRSVSSTR